jgi:hypothetical protein
MGVFWNSMLDPGWQHLGVGELLIAERQPMDAMSKTKTVPA